MTLRQSAVIGQHFAFAYGRTGVLQQSLLSSSDVDRLLGAHTLAEAERILIELPFTKLIDQSLRRHEDILHACAAWVRCEVAAMCPPEMQPVFGILWLEGDLPLLSFLLKRHHGLSSAVSREPSPEFTAYDADALRELVETGNSPSLPARLTAFVRDMRALQPDAKTIDTRVAQFIADLRTSLAAAANSRPIRLFAMHMTDTQNIRTALRLAELPDDQTLPHVLTGGTIRPSLLTGTVPHIAATVRNSGLSYGLADLIEKSPEKTDVFELALSDILAQDIEYMWNRPLRIEPVFAFAATALSQLQILRVIFMGKRNNLTPQEIKKMLPPFLSASHYLP